MKSTSESTADLRQGLDICELSIEEPREGLNQQDTIEQYLNVGKNLTKRLPARGTVSDQSRNHPQAKSRGGNSPEFQRRGNEKGGENEANQALMRAQNDAADSKNIPGTTSMSR